MSRDLINCSQCSGKANYHDKLGIAYCEDCYWKKNEETREWAKKRSFKTYDTAVDTFIKCPYCFCGDTCGYFDGGRRGIGCISDSYGFRHPEGKTNCQVCRVKEQEEKQEKIDRLRNQENRCFHPNITWKENRYCCADCQTSDDSVEFLNALCKHHWLNLKDWMEKNQINILFTPLHDIYWKLVDGATVKDKFTSIEEIQQTYQQVVQGLNQLAKSKGINEQIPVINNSSNKDNNNPREKERKREREQIQQSIKQLEQKPNKTPEDETELEELRKKLQELEKLAKKPTSTEPNNSDKPWLIPVLVIGGIGIVVVIIGTIWLVNKNKKRIRK